MAFTLGGFTTQMKSRNPYWLGVSANRKADRLSRSKCPIMMQPQF
jgi:hypothetical protein